MRFAMLLLLLLLLMSVPQLSAQDAPTDQPVITRDNMMQLQSVDRIDFTDTTEINVGWFVASDTQDRFLLLDRNRQVVVLSSQGQIFRMEDATGSFVDAVAFEDDTFALLFATGTGFDLWYDNLRAANRQSMRISVTTDAIPSAVWVDCDKPDMPCHASIEASSNQETIIYRLPPFAASDTAITERVVSAQALMQAPYLPASDESAVVRIGRIPFPYVVTSSLDGQVKLWHLDDESMRYTVDNTTQEPAVFGNINAAATHLVWRDNANETLYLLDFILGVNEAIAPLNGDYAQWYFLSADASAIIAVNIGGEPNVVVWDTVTGERTDLGHYRDCTRPQPDMARLSSDGTTLIIGCDSGLDIWQIPNDAN